MSDALWVAGQRARVPGLVATNWREHGEPRLRARGRTRRVSEVIVHETVTRSVETTVRVLQRRRLGVHLIVGPDGEVTQHADLVWDETAHAGRTHNRRSIGIEVVTPYYEHLLKPGLPWTEVIDARWAHRRRYVLPTPAQAETTAMLVGWLTSSPHRRLHIPRRFVGLDHGRFRMGRVHGARRAKPGVYAHHAFGHADGAWLVLYCILRLEVGLEPEQAYAEARRLAAGPARLIPVCDA